MKKYRLVFEKRRVVKEAIELEAELSQEFLSLCKKYQFDNPEIEEYEFENRNDKSTLRYLVIKANQRNSNLEFTIEFNRDKIKVGYLSDTRNTRMNDIRMVMDIWNKEVMPFLEEISKMKATDCVEIKAEEYED